MTALLVVELDVAPTSVTKDAFLNICGAVRNVGPSKLDTGVWASRLLINGEPSESWSWAIASGLREEREFALPPGERLEFRRTLPSSSVLAQRGRYELVLEVRGVRSPPVIVELYSE